VNSHHQYHFITQWKVEASCEEVCAILDNAEDLCRWWPSVYLDVAIRDNGDQKGIGKKVDLYTKGWLPYTLKWQFVVTENHEPYGYTIIASGDLNGWGKWTFEQQGKFCLITYDWNIIVDKGILKTLSFLLKPLFSWNHHWAMRKGEISLKIELLKRKKIKTKNPPGPTFPHNLTHNKILS
jgi:hypothetical protein